jgi:6-phosphogluconolactonase (cycloisomerase 2 family)
MCVKTESSILWNRRVAAIVTFIMGSSTPLISHAEDLYFDPPNHRLRHHTVYIDANITTGNTILAYEIEADGSVKPRRGSPFPTGGNGFYDSSFKLGPFDVDQEMALAGNILYAVNAGSNSISAFAISDDGTLSPVRGQPFMSGGSTPVSVGVHGQYLITVDSAQDPAQASDDYIPGVAVSAILDNGALRYLTATPLEADAQPSQALTTNTGAFVFTAEFPGGGKLDAFYQSPNGKLRLTDSVSLPLEPGNTQPLPLGLWANPRAPYLYVGFVNTGEVGVYTLSDAGKLRFVNKAPSSGKAVCWLRVSNDGRFLYSSNTADESMSVYDLTNPALPVEIQHLVVGGFGGVQQFSLTPDGSLLYLLQQENSAASVGKSNVLYGLAVDRHTGMLTLLNSTPLALPANTRPFGVVIR